MAVCKGIASGRVVSLDDAFARSPRPRACGPFLPSLSCFLELVVGMDKVLARQRLVALEARGELDILVGLLVRRESAIFPFAIAERVRVFAAPARALLHRVKAKYIAFDEASVDTF